MSYLCIHAHDGSTLQSFKSDKKLELPIFSTSHHKTDYYSPHQTLLWWLQQYGPEGRYYCWVTSTKNYYNILPSMAMTKTQTVCIFHHCGPTITTTQPSRWQAPTFFSPVPNLLYTELCGSAHTNHIQQKPTSTTIAPVSSTRHGYNIVRVLELYASGASW